jgi:GAF domain-containing protein
VSAYAGIPLFDADGHALGALCAIDDQPHDWTPGEVATLSALAERAAAEIARRTEAAHGGA